VIAWTHGTVGVAPNCNPSLVPNYASALVGIAEFVEAGYVIAATDYQGLGTPGPHPYLVGDAEGMGALGNVRAARDLAEADASADFVVWGQSQGGHASLFAGEVASTYAPELNLQGVVASAPASDLVDLFKTKTSEGTAIGNILISMALSSWARVYDQADLDQIVTPAARRVMNRIAENCIQNPAQILASVPAASALNVTFLSNPPSDTEPWRAILADNTPGDAPTDAPILITQGEADLVVSPAVQQQFVDRLCQTGGTVDYRKYPGGGHVTVAHDAAPT
jgi:alpha-beta hydrolase superfamily lysophospholipase